MNSHTCNIDALQMSRRSGERGIAAEPVHGGKTMVVLMRDAQNGEP